MQELIVLRDELTRRLQMVGSAFAEEADGCFETLTAKAALTHIEELIGTTSLGLNPAFQSSASLSIS